MKFKISTFGCKLNSSDSGFLNDALVQSGFSPALVGEEIGCHVINTCAVTREASLEAKRQIRKLKIKNPFSKVIVTGCAAQVDTDMFSDLAGVDYVVANSHKKEIPAILKNAICGTEQPRVFKSKIFQKNEIDFGSGLMEAHTRVFLKIQDGCDSFCSFCVIPFARGRSRSLSVPSILDRIDDLVAQGIREVVLTGVHIGDYETPDAPAGRDSLSYLVEQILLRTNLLRLRLSSLEPIEISDALLDMFTNDRICSHFHLSLQSGETNVLRDMKRKYGAHDIQNCLKKIHSILPNAYIGMDLITGFPTETDESFRQTYDLLRDHAWTKLHVFPYSERPGTKAATFTSTVYPHVRKERGKKLRELSDSRVRERALAQVGQIKYILPLKSKNEAVGISRDYWHVVLPPDRAEATTTSEMKLQITGVRSGSNVELKNHQEYLTAEMAPC